MIVTPSHLGFQLDGGLLGDNVRMTGKKTASKDETWQQVWGEEDTVRNHYNELTVTFEERVGKKEQMNVQFRVLTTVLASVIFCHKRKVISIVFRTS